MWKDANERPVPLGDYKDYDGVHLVVFDEKNEPAVFTVGDGRKVLVFRDLVFQADAIINQKKSWEGWSFVTECWAPWVVGTAGLRIIRQKAMDILSSLT